ncbi:hypothetical protein MNBD_ALPHA01-1813, partial [hydrothermal vent metagenome]
MNIKALFRAGLITFYLVPGLVTTQVSSADDMENVVSTASRSYQPFSGQ